MPPVPLVRLQKLHVHVGRHQPLDLAPPDMEVIARHVQPRQLLPEAGLVRAAGEQRPQRHVAGDAGKTVKVRDLHSVYASSRTWYSCPTSAAPVKPPARTSATACT